MPVTLVLSYMIGMMTAFKYLRKKGIVCRDFKLDNVMVYEDNIVMIDFGAFVKVDEQQPGNVIYTEGYAPPEVLPVDKDGNNCFGTPAVFDYPSDLYTIIRAIAIATVNDREVKRTSEEMRDKMLKRVPWFRLPRFAFDMPSSDDVKDFAKYPSYQRLLVKGMRKNPEDRFQDTDELSEAMLGVLREVHCQNQWLDDKRSIPGTSTVSCSRQILSAAITITRGAICLRSKLTRAIKAARWWHLKLKSICRLKPSCPRSCKKGRSIPNRSTSPCA